MPMQDDNICRRAIAIQNIFKGSDALTKVLAKVGLFSGIAEPISELAIKIP